jgi:hypothetical protein
MTLNYTQLTNLCNDLDSELSDTYIDLLEQVDTVNILKADNAELEVKVSVLIDQLKRKGLH